MFAGIQKPVYANIRMPVLAFFAKPLSLSEQIQKYKPRDAEERKAMEESDAGDLAIRTCRRLE